MKDLIVRPNSIAVLGYHDGSAGQIAAWFEKTTPYHISCFIHDSESFYVNPIEENKKRVSQRIEYPQNGYFKCKPFIVSLDWVRILKNYGINKVLPLDPDNIKRFMHIKKCLENGIGLVSAIHPSTMILEEAKIDPGVWINAGCIIGYKSEIASGVIINTASKIDHHNVLKSCCQVDPGVTTAGFVTLSEKSYVHTGTIITPKRIVGIESIVGAGSLVLNDIPSGRTAYGVPAKLKK